jgi:hypothetical protein
VTFDEGVLHVQVPSSASAVDLIYTPSAGPHKGVTYVVEYSSSGTTTVPSVTVANSVRQFQALRERPDTQFVLVTSGSVRHDLLDVEVPSGMHIIADVSTGDDLARQLERLVSSSED